MDPDQYPQGLAHFPGIDQIVDGSFSFVHGISPSVAALTIAPQSHYTAEHGTLRFWFGDDSVEFPDCKVDQNSFQRTRSGAIWRLAILDRRWKWSWGEISGSYNVRDDDERIIRDSGILVVNTGTEKTPQELAELCLEAMGEVGYDVSALPEALRPAVEWDHDVPAQMLADICDQAACRVVLGLDNVVRIVKVGQGATLPTDSVMENSQSWDLAERPSAIAIVCAPTMYDVIIELEAVGIENNAEETLVEIAKLSYTPTGLFGLGGWPQSDPPYFDSVTGQRTRVDGTIVTSQALARKSVFKMYRVPFPYGFGWISPSGFEVTAWSLYYLRIMPFMMLTREGGEARPPGAPSERRNLPAEIRGQFWDLTNGGNSAPNTLYEGSFSLDTKHGVVTFTDPVYGNALPVPARMYLHCVINVRNPATRQWDRYVHERSIGPTGTPTRYIKHDEIVLRVSQDGATTTAYRDAVDEECLHYSEAAEAEYDQPTSQTLKYLGLRLIELDGAVQQITFMVGRSGCFTVIYRNTEDLDRVPSYRERRLAEKRRNLKTALAAEKGRIGSGDT